MEKKKKSKVNTYIYFVPRPSSQDLTDNQEKLGSIGESDVRNPHQNSI